MSIQSYQRGYMDKLAQLATQPQAQPPAPAAGTAPATVSTNMPERVRNVYGEQVAVTRPGANPDPADARAERDPALDARLMEAAEAAVVPDEALPGRYIPAVVEPWDGDASEWSGDPGPVYYTVRPGDVLGRISREFGTPVDQIQVLNGIQNPDRIRAGSRIRVR